MRDRTVPAAVEESITKERRADGFGRTLVDREAREVASVERAAYRMRSATLAKALAHGPPESHSDIGSPMKDSTMHLTPCRSRCRMNAATPEQLQRLSANRCYARASSSPAAVPTVKFRC